MKQANDIWKKFVAKKSTLKEAMDEIGTLLQTASGTDTDALVKLSNKIMDHEFPESEPDKELEKQWSKEMYGDENE